jgi:hypothetical protein
MRKPSRTPAGYAKFFAALENGHPVRAACEAAVMRGAASIVGATKIRSSRRSGPRQWQSPTTFLKRKPTDAEDQMLRLGRGYASSSRALP